MTCNVCGKTSDVEITVLTKADTNVVLLCDQHAADLVADQMRRAIGEED